MIRFILGLIISYYTIIKSNNDNNYPTRTFGKNNFFFGNVKLPSRPNKFSSKTINYNKSQDVKY